MIKRLIAAALVAVVTATATAAEVALLEDWRYEDLRSSWKLSQVLDGEVISADGKKVGDVEDVIMDANGLVSSVIVKTGGQMEEKDQYVLISWDLVELETEGGGAVRIDESFRAMENRPMQDSKVGMEAANERSADNLIGIRASADGLTGYGEITDLLISDGDNELIAYLMRADALQAKVVALPADLGWINDNKHVLELPYDVDSLERLEEFTF